jgi:hypothetical protein
MRFKLRKISGFPLFRRRPDYCAQFSADWALVMSSAIRDSLGAYQASTARRVLLRAEILSQPVKRAAAALPARILDIPSAIS